MINTKRIYDTTCPSCLEPVFPNNTQEAQPEYGKLILNCGHVMHLTCYLSGEHVSDRLKNNCWTCNREIDQALIPEKTSIEKCRMAWNWGYEHAPDIINRNLPKVPFCGALLLEVGKGAFNIYKDNYRTSDHVLRFSGIFASMSAAIALGACSSRRDLESIITAIATTIMIAGGAYVADEALFNEGLLIGAGICVVSIALNLSEAGVKLGRSELIRCAFGTLAATASLWRSAIAAIVSKAPSIRQS